MDGPSRQAVVSLTDVSMAFGTNRVLSGVSMEVHAGTVQALIGANGAGKSTLIKILSGVYPNHGGEIHVDGKRVQMDTPSIARSMGIHTVHQKIADGVIPGLSVAENLVFDNLSQPSFGAMFSLAKVLPRARQIASRLDLGWSDSILRKDVFELGIADQQLLLLARALDQQPRMLVLDEPTSALSMSEVGRLFDVIRGLKVSGVAILYVSHHLSEIDTLADSLVVLRDGKIRLEQARPFVWNDVVRAMLGDQVLTRSARSLSSAAPRCVWRSTASGSCPTAPRRTSCSAPARWRASSASSAPARASSRGASLARRPSPRAPWSLTARPTRPTSPVTP